MYRIGFLLSSILKIVFYGHLSRQFYLAIFFLYLHDSLQPIPMQLYSNYILLRNRFLWMVRIGGGVFPVIKEPDYLVNGEYRVDKGAAPKMLNCLM